MTNKIPSREELFAALLQADEELYNQGMGPFRRAREVITLAREKLGFGKTVALGPFQPDDEITSRIRDAYTSIYGGANTRRSFGHGVIEFRGAPYLVNVPIIFGTIKVEPFEHSELSNVQKHLIQNDRQLFERSIFQIGDAFDALMGFSNAVSNLHSDAAKRPYSAQLVSEARKNFLSACTLAVHGLDFRECFLSTFIALELCIKSALSNEGWTDEQLRKIGHEPDRLISALENSNLQIDLSRTRSVLSGLPDFVNTRYGLEEISEGKSIEFLIGTQFVTAELMRHHLTRPLLSSLGKEFTRPFPPVHPNASA